MESFTLHIVPTLHWDREWFLPYQTMRRRLVAVLDHVFQNMGEGKLQSFVLDGQVLPLIDYLKIRPQMKCCIQKWIEEKKLFIGPWYVQTDQFLINGESLVRNLLIGYREAVNFGLRMDTIYVPDACGCVAQLPQIAKLSGILAGIVSRGIQPGNTELIWYGIDGTTMLLAHAPFGYKVAPVDQFQSEQGRSKIVQNIKKLIERSITGNALLLSNVSGHLNSFCSDVELLRRQLGKQFTLQLSSLEQYTDAIQFSTTLQHEAVYGELRDNNEQPLHTEVSSARVEIKVANHHREVSLIHWAEPMLALNAALGGDNLYPFIRTAWEYMLQNQSEDSIRGCHIDTVSNQIMQRYLEVEEICDFVIQEALDRLVELIDFPDTPNSVPFIVVNPLPWKRSELLTAEISVPITWLPVLAQRKRIVEIVDEFGRKIPYTILSRQTTVQNTTASLERPHYEMAPVVNVLLNANDIPSFGYKTYFLQLSDPGEQAWSVYEGASIYGTRVKSIEVDLSGRRIENSYLRVEIMPDGTLKVWDKATGVMYEGLLIFEDSGDAGDTYSYSPPEHQMTMTSEGGTSVVAVRENTPLRVVSQITTDLFVPAKLSKDRQQRTDELIPLHIETLVSLEADSRHLNLDLHVNNTARDHRLRVLFNTNIQSDQVTVCRPFAVERKLARPTQHSGVSGHEYVNPTMTVQHGVDITESDKGLTILTGGLREFEALEKPTGTIALTLIRAVGYLNRNDLLLRSLPMAPFSFETDGAQCIGKHRFSLQLIFHDGDDVTHSLTRSALEFEVAPRATVLNKYQKSNAAFLPLSKSFIEIKPSALVISCLKQADEEDDSMILRLYNPTSKNVIGEIEHFGHIHDIQFVDFLERPINENLNDVDGLIRLNFKPYQIHTLKCKLNFMK